MKTARLVLSLFALLVRFADGAQKPVASDVESVPVAKILVIGRFNAPPTPEQLQLFSLRLYAAGKIDQWYSPLDGNGVVIILNLPSIDAARALLEGVPPGQPRLMTFELIPIRQLTPLIRLLPQSSKPAQ